MIRKMAWSDWKQLSEESRCMFDEPLWEHRSCKNSKQHGTARAICNSWHRKLHDCVTTTFDFGHAAL